MNIIALETSTQPGSIAASADGAVVFERSLPTDKKTAESFATELQKMLHELDWSPKDVDAIAVCEGPGSFTGLRIGITAAKSFAYATNAAVIAPSTMRVLAWQAKLQDAEELWCVIDAQRGELFASMYRREDTDRSNVEIEPTRIYSIEDWCEKLRPNQIVIGEGLRRVSVDVLRRLIVRDESIWGPTAAALAKTAEEMHREGAAVDPWKLVPQYYRKSAAEEKLADS